MEDATLRYLYQPNMVLEVFILLVILCTFTKPKILTAVMATLLLLRPNERFECFVSYPKLIFPTLALSLFLFSDKSRIKEQVIFDKQLLLFLAFIVIQTMALHSEDLAKNSEFIIVGFLLYYAVNLFSYDQDGAKLLNYAIIFSCFTITAEAVYYHYTEPPESLVWQFFHTLKAGRLQAWGNWRNANETAFIACIGVTNTILLCVRSGSKIIYSASALLIPFLTLVVFLTASRAGLATLLLIFLPLIFLSDFKIIKVTVITALIVVVFLASSFSPQRADTEGSTEERLELRQRGIQLFKENSFIGVGFQRVRNDLGGMPVHNTYLQALVETGLLGAPLLFYFLYKIGFRIYSAIIINKLFSLNLALVAGQYVSSLFYFLWGNQLLSVLFFLILAQISTGIKLGEDRS